jgi:hypothetical protein
MASEQVTERYLEGWSAGEEREKVRALVLGRRMDATGKKTNLKTVVGFACAQGGLDASGVTSVLRAAQRDYDAGMKVCDLSRSNGGLTTTGIQESQPVVDNSTMQQLIDATTEVAVQQLVDALGVQEAAARGALEATGGHIDQAAALLLG